MPKPRIKIREVPSKIKIIKVLNKEDESLLEEELEREDHFSSTPSGSSGLANGLNASGTIIRPVRDENDLQEIRPSAVPVGDEDTSVKYETNKIKVADEIKKRYNPGMQESVLPERRVAVPSIEEENRRNAFMRSRNQEIIEPAKTEDKDFGDDVQARKYREGSMDRARRARF